MRRRALGIIIAVCLAVTARAQSSQDFASKFMEICDVDTAVQCVTVSPRMMEQLTQQADSEHNAGMAQAIQKLKSARIVTTSVDGEAYYREAEDLLKKNPQRFAHNKDYRNASAHGTFYTRKTRSGDIVELVMLHSDTAAGTLVIVNLTGDIDDEFVSSLMQTFSNRKDGPKE